MLQLFFAGFPSEFNSLPSKSNRITAQTYCALVFAGFFLYSSSAFAGESGPSHVHLSAHAKKDSKLVMEAAPASQPDMSNDYYFLGASMEKVLRIQGAPDKTYDMQDGEYDWFYDGNILTFKNGKLTAYKDYDGKLLVGPKHFRTASPGINASSSTATSEPSIADTVQNDSSIGQNNSNVGSHNSTDDKDFQLRAEYPVSQTPQSDYYWIGSSMDTVRQIQGAPDSYDDRGHDWVVWKYGKSELGFVNGALNYYNNVEKNLKVGPKAQ